MSTSRILAAAVAVVGTFCLAPSLRCQDSPSTQPAEAAAKRTPPATPLIAVVDLTKALEQSPRYAADKKRIAAMQDEVRERMKQIDARLDDLRAAIDVTGDPEEKREAQFQLEIAQQQRQFQLKSLSDRIDKEIMRAQIEAYAEAEAAVPAVAKARGVSIVLRSHEPLEPADLSKGSFNQLQRRMLEYERRQVWHVAPELDLTADLIRYLQIPRDDQKAGKADADAGKPKSETPKDGAANGTGGK